MTLSEKKTQEVSRRRSGTPLITTKKHPHEIKNIVFETEWFTIDAVPYGDSGEPYYRLSCSDSVSIIAKTSDGKIILVRQYRPAVACFTYEFPSGYVDDNESNKKAMGRELEEETGYRCRRMTCMGALKIVPSRINNTLYVFFGKGAELMSDRKTDGDTELVLVTPDEFKNMILSSEWVDSSSVAMFQMAQLNGYL